MMSYSFVEELVYTSSEDGFLLEGVLMRPVGADIQPTTSVVWIHGNASRFYDYPYVMIGRALAGAGYIFISANTRGHDISTFLWRAGAGKPAPWNTPQAMPIGAGSAWERLDEAPRDLAAWVDMAAGLGTGGVVLAGHSSGAQRVVLYQAERQDPRVVGIVLASPDLRGFMPHGEAEAAQRLVADGRGMEVLPAQPFAPWYLQSAQSVASRSAVLSHLLESLDGEPTIAAIHTPFLAIVGASERGGEDTLKVIQRQARAAESFAMRVIADADHVYTAHEAEVAEVIVQWLQVRAKSD